jgi:YHS domain-containing protein/thiol-disulfide isomerase/thioredoxin
MSAFVSLMTIPLLVTPVTTEAEHSVADVVLKPTEQAVAVQPSGWTESFVDAQSAAAEKNVPMLLHFDASWCGACRRMDAQVLSRPEVKAMIGDRLIGVRIDADRNRDLINRYRVATLPTEIVVAADGTEGSRYVGAVSLQTYLERLNQIAAQSAVAKAEPTQKSGETREQAAESDNETRSCLIVRRDGKMVGLGGFSPVALSEQKKWQRGKDEFVVQFQGVEYFLQSKGEVRRFQATPQKFIPHLHGCDPVELHFSKQARTGVIEFGSFYKGEMFFFASLENRSKFQNNPVWYLGSDQQPETAGEAVQLLDMMR